MLHCISTGKHVRTTLWPIWAHSCVDKGCCVCSMLWNALLSWEQGLLSLLWFFVTSKFNKNTLWDNRLFFILRMCVFLCLQSLPASRIATICLLCSGRLEWAKVCVALLPVSCVLNFMKAVLCVFLSQSTFMQSYIWLCSVCTKY